MWKVEPAPTVRATYLLETWLEERIIATYFTLFQQPINHSSFCSNLLASPTLCVHPVIPAAHPLCLAQPITATTWTLHCAALLKCRGSKGFGGGRQRIDNWPNLLHHAGFLLENGKMANICMIATSQMPGSIIKLFQYYHTTIPTPHSSQTCKYHPSLALLRPHIYMMTCSIEIYF